MRIYNLNIEGVFPTCTMLLLLKFICLALRVQDLRQNNSTELHYGTVVLEQWAPGGSDT